MGKRLWTSRLIQYYHDVFSKAFLESKKRQVKAVIFKKSASYIFSAQIISVYKLNAYKSEREKKKDKAKRGLLYGKIKPQREKGKKIFCEIGVLTGSRNDDAFVLDTGLIGIGGGEHHDRERPR